MIYCVEDDESIRQLEIYALNSAGLEVKGFADAASLWQALSDTTPELIILDIMLPDEDGLSILQNLRKNSKTSSIPVLMASAKGTEYDKVLGLDSGADDYISKPFGMLELVARAKALIRRIAANSSDTLTVGDISINIVQHKVYVKGQEIILTRKEFAVLQTLMNNPQHVMSRDLLLTQIWGYTFDGETRTVDVHMRSLRTKLGSAGAQIETVRGIGYRISSVAQQNEI